MACRLDRFMLSESVMMVGGDLKAVVMPVVGSNHWPISMEWENVRVKPRRPFRFEKFWPLQPDFHKKLKDWWESSPPIKGTRMYQFQQKLKLLKGHIKKWNKESFDNIFQEKQFLENKIKLNQSQVISSGYSKELRIQEKLLLQKFSQREQQEEVY